LFDKLFYKLNYIFIFFKFYYIFKFLFLFFFKFFLNFLNFIFNIFSSCFFFCFVSSCFIYCFYMLNIVTTHIVWLAISFCEKIGNIFFIACSKRFYFTVQIINDMFLPLPLSFSPYLVQFTKQHARSSSFCVSGVGCCTRMHPVGALVHIPCRNGGILVYILYRNNFV